MLQLEVFSSRDISNSPIQKHPNTCSLSIHGHAAGFWYLMLTPLRNQFHFGLQCVLQMMEKRQLKKPRNFKLCLLNFSVGKPFVADTVIQEVEIKLHTKLFKVKKEHTLSHAVVAVLSGLSNWNLFYYRGNIFSYFLRSLADGRHLTWLYLPKRVISMPICLLVGFSLWWNKWLWKWCRWRELWWVLQHL